MQDEVDRAKLVTLFDALRCPTRLHIVQLLAERGEMTVTDLFLATAQSPSAVSMQLASLARFGLVDVRKVGNWNLWRLNGDIIRSAASTLRRLAKPKFRLTRTHTFT